MIRLRAQFVVQYLSMLPEGRRSAIERASMWTHELVPQSEYERRLDGGAPSSEWQGRLAAMRSMLIEQQKANQKAIDEKISATIGGLDAKIDAKIGDLDAKIGDLDAKIDANQKAILDAIKVLSPP